MLDYDAKLAQLTADCAEPGWDSYGGDPLSPRATAAAKRFLDGLFVCPTVNGGVALSWLAESISVEFDRDGHVGNIVFDLSELRDRLGQEDDGSE